MRNRRTRRRFGPEQPKEKIRRAEFKRDEEFCQFLAKELDVEKAPASYRKALRAMYAELPQDMPVRHYPVRSALKNLAAAAVVLAVFAVSLLGANRVYPQLTESLPGVGMIFKTINGTKDDTPQPPGPVERTVQKEGKQAHKMPGFTAVQAEDENGNGELSVKNAWCDGAAIYLDMCLCLRKEALGTAAGTQPPEDIIFFQETDGSAEQNVASGSSAELFSSLSVNGSPVENFCAAFVDVADRYSEQNSLLVLRYDGTGPEGTGGAGEDIHYSGVWVLEVPEDARDRESFSVQMDLSHAWVFTAEGLQLQLPTSLRLSLEVEADSGFEFGIEKSGTDNGYLLKDINCTPGRFGASITVPYMGHYGSSLLPGADYFGGASPDTPYGMYAVLTEEDGTVLWECGLFDQSEYDPNTGRYPPIKFSALLRPADREKLVLTLYQFDPHDLEAWSEGFAQITMAPDEIINPVTAEFTIDLAEGTAKPSENYLENDQIKLDSARPLKEPNHPDFENGVYVQAVDAAWMEGNPAGQALVELAINSGTYTGTLQNLALQCYLDGEIAQAVYGCDVTDDSVYNTVTGAGVKAYNSGGGCFWREEQGQSFYEPNTYLHVFFLVDYPEWMERDEKGQVLQHFDSMRLVDTGSGEILVEDVQAAYEKNLYQVLTAAPYIEDVSRGLDGQVAANGN